MKIKNYLGLFLLFGTLSCGESNSVSSKVESTDSTTIKKEVTEIATPHQLELNNDKKMESK